MNTLIRRTACAIAAGSALATTVAPAPATAADTLVPHTAVYKIRISIARGTLTTVVRQEDEAYEVHSLIEPTGFADLLINGTIEESSRFSVGDNGVTPLVYRSDDTLSSDKEKVDFDFDWGSREVAGTINGEPVSFPLEKDVHDRVSIQYQLMHNLMTGGAGSEYSMLDGDELREISVRNVGTRSIKVPYGRYDAIGIQHQKDGSKRITTLWCAAELGYLPVMIEQERKGKSLFRAELMSYEPGNPDESSLSATN